LGEFGSALGINDTSIAEADTAEEAAKSAVTKDNFMLNGRGVK